ncbi:MAG TPA: hemolysin D, partial [Pirellulales bacterium]
VDQSDVEHVRVGQEVAVVLDAFSNRLFHGKIADVSRAELEHAPDSLSNKAGGRLATHQQRSGEERPLFVCYRARVPLDDPNGLLRPGLRGNGKILVGEQTWGEWAMRGVNRTFHFNW